MRDRIMRLSLSRRIVTCWSARSAAARAMLVAAALLVAVPPASAEDALINVITLGDQYNPVVARATLAGGDQLAVWVSAEDQVINLRGAKVIVRPLGAVEDAGDRFSRAEFEVALNVSSGVAWLEMVPFQAMDTFAVVWESGDGAVFARCFQTGTTEPITSPFVLGSSGVGRGTTMSRGAAAATVSWWADNGNQQEVRQRVELGYDCAAASPTPDPLVIPCLEPAGAANPNVEVTACVHDAGGGNDTDIWLAVDSGSVTTEIMVNTYATGKQNQPAVAVVGNRGDFVVAWTSLGSPGSDSSGLSVQGRRFDASGAPVGDQFQVNSYTTDYQLNPAVAAGDDGDFVVVWDSVGSNGTDRSATSIQARWFPADGAAPGGQLQVNSYTTGAQEQGSAGVAGDGTFFIAWSSAGSNGGDDDGTSIQGRLIDVLLLFGDGFEQGTTGAWSSTTP